MPTTPMGTRSLVILSPFGRVHARITSPTGSGSKATSLTPLAMERMRSDVRRKRSIAAGLSP